MHHAHCELSVSAPPVGALLIPFGPNRDRPPRLPPTCARAPANGERPAPGFTWVVSSTAQAMRFSERLGIVTARNVIQLDDLDAPLRNSLWNLVQIHVFAPLDREQWVNQKPEFHMIRALWVHFFKRPLDEIQGYWPREKPIIREWFFGAKWFEVYDFVEFIAKGLQGETEKRYLETANSYLAREMSAFRFVGDSLTRVTSAEELQAIQAGLQDARELPGVRRMRSTCWFHAAHSLAI